MSDAWIDSFFNEDEPVFYPGSRHKRRPLSPVVEQRRLEAAELALWDSNPIIKIVSGTPTEMFTAGDLGKALGGFSVVSVRLWERRGYIPLAPFRMPDVHLANGTIQPGRRYYSRPIVEATIDEFDRRGLIGKKRIEWKHHTDLPIALVERWGKALPAN